MKNIQGRSGYAVAIKKKTLAKQVKHTTFGPCYLSHRKIEN